MTIAGQSVILYSVSVNGRTYIDRQQLQDALEATGGANPQASVTGCLNKPLFNGI